MFCGLGCVVIIIWMVVVVGIVILFVYGVFELAGEGWFGVGGLGGDVFLVLQGGQGIDLVGSDVDYDLLIVYFDYYYLFVCVD